ncbi:MAG: bestrophin family ion channel [Capnocytophaga sp.]|nr:bestrophin family ion channel [Capnocytophaga sp.]
MFISRKLTRFVLWSWFWRTSLLTLSFNAFIATCYSMGWITLSLPWLPVSVIGTAVAFFVGFKNNQAYDRMWEARKIWGGIVNDSRTFAMLVGSFITPKNGFTEKEVEIVKKKLIYRHIGWLYTHRWQLLEPTRWEQVLGGGFTQKSAERHIRKHGLGTVDDVTIDDVRAYLGDEEFDQYRVCKNMATQLINRQSKDIMALYEKGVINDFQQMQLENVLRTFYELQGRNERIKKFPFPRDYSSMSAAFVTIFVCLFPFSLIPELMLVSNLGQWISIPIASIISLVYIVMEQLGDYHENPFMGTPHAMPMLSMCRTIEIDMREMIGETDLPPAISPVESVLM